MVLPYSGIMIAMYVEKIPNRTSPPAILVREAWRENGRIRKRTLANLSKLPPIVVALVTEALKGRSFLPVDEHFAITRTKPHGHVAAVLGTMGKLGLSAILGGRGQDELRFRQLSLAMIAARILNPASKLATFRSWENSTLAETFGVTGGSKEELYHALDWLLARQPAIEQQLVRRHLAPEGESGPVVLFDLTSTYLEGTKCPLGRYGHSRDHRPDRLQVEFGLVADREGRPLAVEVFEGNTADPTTLSATITKLKERFGLERVIVIGDRGMVTQTRIDADLKPNDLSWITALRHPSIRKLLEGPLQLSLFDERNLAEISSPDFPDERLVACRNPTLADETARQRTELLQATEKALIKVQEAVAAGRLKKCGAIGGRVQGILNRYKTTRFFRVRIEDCAFTWERNDDLIAREKTMDGLYVLRSNVPSEQLPTEEVVRHYKSLAKVERAFRTIKSASLEVRPIFHHLADRVKAHIFPCMLAYYVEWEMRRLLAPLLFADEDRAAANPDPVLPSHPSPEGLRKTGSRTTPEGTPLHSFKSLLQELATLAINTIQVTPQPSSKRRAKASADAPVDASSFPLLTSPTFTQQEAFKLLKITL